MIATVWEGGLRFKVNFTDYLDTGLFLDHRPVRSLVRERVGELAGLFDDSVQSNSSDDAGKRHGSKRGNQNQPRGVTFLNLFAYTGSATVYAADGGASATTTVDLSQTYLNWAEENMRMNGFSGRSHEYVRADCTSWILEARRAYRHWDVIFVDPPTYSNSKSMGKRTWDVQRDHVELLAGVTRLLTPRGIAVFSCNLRTFKPDLEALEKARVKLTNITKKTIDEDFSRNQRIHHCYLVERLETDASADRREGA